MIGLDGRILMRSVGGGTSKSLIKYGKLYEWAATQVTLITGMTVPTDAELTALSNYIDTNYNVSPDDFGVGNHIKHPRKNGTPVLSSEYNTSTHPRWAADDTDYGRDTVNFSGLPGGYGNNGTFYTVGYYGRWWSSTEYGSSSAYSVLLYYNGANVDRGTNSRAYGFSVRCLRDATTAEQSEDDGTIVGQVQDYDENIYDLVKIDDKVWTRQNLATTKDMNGNAVTCYDYDNDDSYTFFATEGDSIW